VARAERPVAQLVGQAAPAAEPVARAARVEVERGEPRQLVEKRFFAIHFGPAVYAGPIFRHGVLSVGVALITSLSACLKSA
jgi:hypothetical protein